MNIDSYNAWLAERGIDAPSCQPFAVFASDVRHGAEVWLAADAEEADKAIVEQALKKLAVALEALGCFSSWAVVASGGGLPPARILKAMSPLTKHIFYVSDHNVPASQNSGMSDAWAEISVHRYPGIVAMNRDPEIKKNFWESLKKHALSC